MSEQIAACAHSVVKYVPVEVSPLVFCATWKCRDCGTEFEMSKGVRDLYAAGKAAGEGDGEARARNAFQMVNDALKAERDALRAQVAVMIEQLRVIQHTPECEFWSGTYDDPATCSCPIPGMIEGAHAAAAAWERAVERRARIETWQQAASLSRQSFCDTLGREALYSSTVCGTVLLSERLEQEAEILHRATLAPSAPVDAKDKVQ